jgi:predicted dithiol-disulfide oxidoreductase (DUF899 family)
MLLQNQIVGRKEWKKRRARLLVQEKRLTRQRDTLAARIRNLPWARLDKAYEFHTTRGKRTLADLFEGKSQLLVYHFMLGPGWREGCPSCSFWADHFASFKYHLPQRDVAFKVISRAPLKEIERYRKRMGWKFDWVSSAGSSFNKDFGVSSGKDDESPGFSIFARVGKNVFHTYFTTGRGIEILNSTYGVLDLVPKGRNEEGLEWPMQWVRRHDEYSATRERRATSRS